MTRIAVIDYGMGNLRSVCRALAQVAPAARIEIADHAATVRAADRIVFPGQGAMPDCMAALDSHGLRTALLEAASSKPFLGLCIGLQMLFDASEEGPTPGLGLLKGQVRRFPAEHMFDGSGNRLKVPHMGWNEVCQTSTHPLWADIPDGSRFYFVHSYFADICASPLTLATTSYPFRFTCAVGSGNLFAVQFHPEKSAESGLLLLRNFVHWSP